MRLSRAASKRAACANCCVSVRAMKVRRRSPRRAVAASLIGADLPVMRVDVVDHEGRIAGEAEQEIGRQFGKPGVAMGQLMRDRRTGKGKEIAGQLQRANRFERMLGEARPQRGEAHQQNCQQGRQAGASDERLTVQNRHRLSFSETSSSPLTSSANDPKTRAKSRELPRSPSSR